MATPARPPFIRNVSDIPWKERGQGPYGYGVKDIGAAAGARAFGLSLYRIDPGHIDFPTHWHATEEEVFLGLFGAPHLVQTDFDGERIADSVLGPGHIAAFPADRRIGHHLEVPKDASAPAVVLAIGQRSTLDVANYPGRDVWVIRHGGEGVEAARQNGYGLFRATPAGYYDGIPEALSAAPKKDGSSHETDLPERYGVRADDKVAPVPLVDMEHVEPRTFGKGPYARQCTRLGQAAGSIAFDIHHDEIAPGHVDSPFHYHMGDEEMFYILSGVGLLRLGGPGWTGDDAYFPVGEGDCISFPAATGIAHQILVPGETPEPLNMLTISDRAPIDVVRMVDSKKWIVKRVDVPRELATAMGLGVWKEGQHAQWLDDEPLSGKTLA